MNAPASRDVLSLAVDAMWFPHCECKFVRVFEEGVPRAGTGGSAGWWSIERSWCCWFGGRAGDDDRGGKRKEVTGVGQLRLTRSSGGVDVRKTGSTSPTRTRPHPRLPAASLELDVYAITRDIVSDVSRHDIGVGGGTCTLTPRASAAGEFLLAA